MRCGARERPSKSAPWRDPSTSSLIGSVQTLSHFRSCDGGSEGCVFRRAERRHVHVLAGRPLGASDVPKLSTSTEPGPRIGAEKGPPAVCCGKRLTRRSLPMAQAGQARFLNRQLSFPVSTMSQWWVSRSRSAVVILGSPKTAGHSPKARLVVTMTEVRS